MSYWFSSPTWTLLWSQKINCMCTDCFCLPIHTFYNWFYWCLSNYQSHKGKLPLCFEQKYSSWQSNFYVCFELICCNIMHLVCCLCYICSIIILFVSCVKFHVWVYFLQEGLITHGLLYFVIFQGHYYSLTMWLMIAVIIDEKCLFILWWRKWTNMEHIYRNRVYINKSEYYLVTDDFKIIILFFL